MADLEGKVYQGHSAYRVAVVSDKHPAKIECIDVWRDKLVVGCTEGYLIIWEVFYKLQTQTYTTQEVKYQRSFSKKPINQISVIENQNLLISLSDSALSIHTLPDLMLITTIAKSKGCYFYVVEETPDGGIRLCIVLKRKLLLMEWNGSDFVEIKELSVPDTVKTVVFAGKSLCVGFKAEFNLIDIETGVMKELFAAGKSPPLALTLPDKQLLLCRDNLSICLGFDGKPSRKHGISWTEAPIAIYYSFPYLFGLTLRQMEVRRIFGGENSFVQNFSFRETKSVAFSQKSSNRASSVIYVANRTQIFRLDPFALHHQIEQLVSTGAYDDALLFVELVDSQDLPDKEDRMRNIKLLLAYRMFIDGKAARAMEIFIALNVDPIQVLALFPNMLPTGLQAQVKHPAGIEKLPALEGAGLLNALTALIQFLVTKRSRLAAQRNPEDPNTGDKPQNQVEWNATSDLAVILDTCLLKSYIKTNEKLVSPLLRLQNYCHVKECETLLITERKFADLIWLYKGKGLHESALKVLQKLGQDPPVPNQPNLSGPLPSVEYMKNLNKDNLGLIFTFAKWVLLKYPDNGLNIFTQERNEGDSLPSDKVLQYLKQLAPENVELTQKLVVEFLEHIIYDKHDATPDFHNELIYQYFDIVLSLKRQQPDKTKVQIAGSEGGALGIMRCKLVEFLEQSADYNASKMLSRYKFAEEGLYEEKAILLSKIGEHALALKEYVHRLQDFAQAEEYCIKHYSPDDERGKDVFLQLLQILTKDKDIVDPTACLAFAFELLNRHFREIDIPKALDFLPPETHINKLAPFFTSVWRDKNKQRRESSVLLNIRRSEMMKVKKELWRLRAVVIKITDETTCTVCNKRIGDALFAYHPNTMEVVHFTCYNKQLVKKQREEQMQQQQVLQPASNLYK